jgi:hypothetical protein
MNTESNYPDKDFLKLRGFKLTPEDYWVLKVKHSLLTNPVIEIDRIKKEFFIFVFCQGGMESIVGLEQEQACIYCITYSSENLNSLLQILMPL